MATNLILEKKIRVGVLALQGDVIEHLHALERVGAEAVPVKTQAHLDAVQGLIIPGGESTTLVRLLSRFHMDSPIVERVRSGMAIWGTCMGMILLSHEIAEIAQPTLDLLDITVRRNAFGRQIDSAEVALEIPAIGDPPFPAVFIRAPWIERVGPSVELLAEYHGHGVLVRQANVLASSFHPELTCDDRLHRLFLAMITQTGQSGQNPATI